VNQLTPCNFHALYDKQSIPCSMSPIEFHKNMDLNLIYDNDDVCGALGYDGCSSTRTRSSGKTAAPGSYNNNNPTKTSPRLAALPSFDTLLRGTAVVS
jgi:hypothetical protein